jgi:hypothetical protein
MEPASLGGGFHQLFQGENDIPTETIGGEALPPFAIFTSRGLERALLCWKGKAIRKSLGLTPDLFHKKCSLFSLRKRKENV